MELMSTGSAGTSPAPSIVANLEELDSIIAEWRSLQDRIWDRADKLRQTAGLIEPPGDDLMSKFQAQVAIASLYNATNHCQAMAEYAASYVVELETARADYLAADEDAAADVRHAGEK